MASRWVPDFSAVLVALEHIKELEKEVKDEGVQFGEEASVHLAAISAGIMGLEAERRAAREQLEVATIENSKLRHEMNTKRDQMSAVILTDVEAARAANAEETEQLRKELNDVMRGQEATVKNIQEVESANELRSTERDVLKARHQEAINALNQERSQMYALKSHLDETKEKIQEVEISIDTYRLNMATQEEDLASYKEAFAKGRDQLSNNLEEVAKKINCQEEEILKCRKKLEVLREHNRDESDNKDDLCVQTVKLESSIGRQQENKSLCEKQLEAEKEKYKELLPQKEALQKQLTELIGAFNETINQLKGEIAVIDEKMVGTRAISARIQGALERVREVFKVVNDEETGVRTEYDHVSELLDKSRLQLEERIGSIVRHKKEMDEMEMQMMALKEMAEMNNRVFERDQEELCDKIDEVKCQIEVFEEEKKQLLKLLAENKKAQEEYVKTMIAKTNITRRKVKELQTEQSALKEKQPMTPEEIKSFMKKSQAKYEQIENVCHEEMQECTNNFESVMKAVEKQQNEVAEKKEILKAVEAKWKEEVERHKKLKKEEMEFKMKKCDLEKSIAELKEETASLLEPKENLKVELERVQGESIDQQRKQMTELKSVEVNIYNSSVKLVQVLVENSRLHLQITQMTQDMSKADEDKRRYAEQTEKLKHQTHALKRNLQEAWRDELLLTKERHSKDVELMVQMDELQKHLKTRGQQLGHVQTMLHNLMLDFSRRLGVQISDDPQS